MAARWRKKVYDVAGFYGFAVPSGVKHVLVEMCGGGGGGAGGMYGASLTGQGLTAGGGGGGSAQLVTAELDVVPGEILDVDVGAGGTAGAGGIRASATIPTVGGDGTVSRVHRGGSPVLAVAHGAGGGGVATSRGTGVLSQHGVGCKEAGTQTYAKTANTHQLKRQGNGAWSNSSGASVPNNGYASAYGYNGSTSPSGVAHTGLNGYSGGGGGGGGAEGPFFPTVLGSFSGAGGPAGTSANVPSAGTDGSAATVPGGGGGGGGPGGSGPAGMNGGAGGVGGDGKVIFRWLE